MVDRTDHEMQHVAAHQRRLGATTPHFQQREMTHYKELYIEPASYILDDDRYSFLPPSKVLMLGLLPFVSAGVFYYSDASHVAHVLTDKKAEQQSVIADAHDNGRNNDNNLVTGQFKTSIERALLEPAQHIKTQQEMAGIAYRKPLVTVGAQGFHTSASQPKVKQEPESGRNKNKRAIKKLLAKQVALAMRDPLFKSLSLPTIKQTQAMHVANLSTVRLVNTKPSPKKTNNKSKPNKKIPPIKQQHKPKSVHTGKIMVMAHDAQGRGNVLRTDYFVYQNGKQILYKKNSAIVDFQLPVGDYVLRAIHSSNKEELFIRDMKIAVKPNKTVFPIFVFDTARKKSKNKQAQSIKIDDLKIPAELLLHNDGYDDYASSDYLDVISKRGLPMGVGYVRKSL